MLNLLFWVFVSVTFVLALALAYLRWVASRITVDDNSTICCISKLGIVCKLSYICGFSVRRVEEHRFTFYPIGICHAPGESEEWHGHSEADMLDYVEQTKDLNNRTLIVAFAGGATNKVGIRWLEFRRILMRGGSRTAECDQLFVLDSTGMSFYDHGSQGISALLRKVSPKYRNVVMVGNCMGATGALRFACDLFSPSSIVLAFNPEIDPGQDTRLDFRIAKFFEPNVCNELLALLERSINSCTSQIHIHTSIWSPELAQSKLIPCSQVVEIESSDVVGCSEALDKVSAATSSKGSVVRFVHMEATFHGMLAKLLRPQGGLATILDVAVVPSIDFKPACGS